MRAQAEAAVLARLPLHSEAGGAHAAAASAVEQAAAATALLAVSADGRWAAVASRQNVHLVDLAKLQCHGMLPALQARPSAMGITESTQSTVKAALAFSASCAATPCCAGLRWLVDRACTWSTWPGCSAMACCRRCRRATLPGHHRV